MPSISTSRFIRRSLSAALLLAVSGAGCTDDSQTAPTDVDESDTTAPLVVTSVPAANAMGVPADQRITVTFSEPMDPGTIEKAYSSPTLPLDTVSLAWNPELTVLTISPDQPLAYAEGSGTDPSSVTPLTYAITIGAEAADLAGNAIGTSVQLSFATKRRLFGSFSIDPNLTKSLLDAALLSGVSLYVGDNGTGKRYHSYVTFDLSTLPAGSEVESATFEGRQTTPFNMPYSLGAILAQHLTYSTMDNIGMVPAMSLPGEFSVDANIEAKVIDVTPQVQDDVINRAARGHRSQYRLQIDQATNNNPAADTAVFTKNTFEMSVTYVVD